MKQKLPILLLPLFFCLLPKLGLSLDFDDTVQSLAEEVGHKLTKNGKRKVAIADFVDPNQRHSELGAILAEEFALALVDVGKRLEVMDRGHLKDFISESNASVYSSVDAKTARSLGRLKQVEVLITGVLIPMGEEFKLGIKLIDTETTLIIGSGKGNFPKNNVTSVLYEAKLDQRPSPVEVEFKPTEMAESGMIESPRGNILQKGDLINFEFQLHKCEVMKSKRVKCEVTVINRGQTRGFSLLRGTRMFDNFGNPYKIVGARLADSQDKSKTSRILQSNIPTRLLLVFDSVNDQASTASVIEIMFNDNRRFKFQDVTLVR